MGMSRTTGKRLDDYTHIRQSILDILTTPIGQRVMRRAYGSRLFYLIDAPLNDSTRLAIVAETGQALATWEPRIAVSVVEVVQAVASIAVSIRATILATGEQVNYEGIQLT
jgi:uncharacterized protein